MKQSETVSVNSYFSPPNHISNQANANVASY